MSSPGVVALIGLLGAVVGAVISLAGSVWTTRIADRRAKQERQVIAYQAFIIALDHFDELWTGDADLYRDTAVADPLASQSCKYAEEIQVAFAPVLLLAPKEPREAADAVRKAAWAIDDYLSPPPGERRGTTDLPTLIQQFRANRQAFTEAAVSR